MAPIVVRVFGCVGSGKSTFLNKLVGELNPEYGKGDEMQPRFVQHFSASDRPEGQLVDPNNSVPIARKACDLKINVRDTEGLDAMDGSTISVLDGLLNDLKSEPSVIFLVMPFGRLDHRTCKYMKLMRFCTGMTQENCFLVLTKAETVSDEGNIISSRKRDPRPMVTRLNEYSKIETDQGDLFVQGRNVICVGNDRDVDENMNEICMKLPGLQPVCVRHNYSEFKSSLEKEAARMDAELLRLGAVISNQDAEVSTADATQNMYRDFAKLELECVNQMARESKVPRALRNSGMENYAMMDQLLQRHEKSASDDHDRLKDALLQSKSEKDTLTLKRCTNKAQLENWCKLAGDLGISLGEIVLSH